MLAHRVQLNFQTPNISSIKTRNTCDKRGYLLLFLSIKDSA